MRYDQISVPYKGGFKGAHVPVDCLIDNKIIIDVLNFKNGASQIRDCKMLCTMQIQIGGKLKVTWHSSEILTAFLEDCRSKEVAEDEAIFPIEQCIIVVGDDRGYYFAAPDADSVVPDEKELERMMRKYKKRR